MDGSWELVSAGAGGSFELRLEVERSLHTMGGGRQSLEGKLAGSRLRLEVFPGSGMLSFTRDAGAPSGR
jgi:hypothetical protein